MVTHHNEKGFTMIEIAIVLIIIGIIIGAVVKGKDLISSAEQKKIYTKFISAWQNAYLTFYDRTGLILGDIEDATGAAGQDGWADTGGATMCNNTTAGLYGLTQVGIDCPVTNTATSYEYKYKDSAGNSHNLTVAFLAVTSGTNNYNYMELQNMTTELGMAIDKMIDGKADGLDGEFFNVGSTSSPTATAWGDGDGPTDTVTARWKMQF